MTDDEIQQALDSEELDIRMDVDPESPEHQWFRMALDEGRRLCGRSGLPLTFTFNCSPNIQAYALYRYDVIAISAGCFDFICRIADRIIAKGIYQAVGTPPTPAWAPQSKNTEETNRSLIQKAPFSPLTATWLGDPERKELFAYLMLTLFRFVVLHEIGHFHHRHGVRFTAGSGMMDVDSAQPKKLAEADALDSQARELVADKFACENLGKIIEDEEKKLAALPLTRTFASQYLDTKVKRISFILQIAYIYFSSTDRLPNADPVTSTRMSHPPAPFRLTTIVATSQTGFESEKDRKEINAFILVADAIMAVTLDRTPSIQWLAQLDHPRFSDHYNNLYDRVDTWAVSPQKAPISATNLL